MAELLKLNDDNYFSLEADRNYLSVSQFKSFLPRYSGCEAKAMAILKGEYKELDNTALLVGSYLHEHFSGTLDKYKEQHPEILTKSGTLKCQYQQANDMINCLETDKSFQELYQGDREKIITFNLFGVPWKAKIDLLNLEHGYFCDLKTVRDFKDIWDDQLHQKINFIQSRGYNLQMAVYREGIRQTYNINTMDGFIVAVTKETPPDKGIYYFNQEHYEHALRIVEENIEHVLDVKEGRVEPKRCGHCDYCRQTATLADAKLFEEVEE